MRHTGWGVIIVVLMMGVIAGCAGRQINPNYQAYVNTVSALAEKAPPTFVVECPPGGCQFKKLEYYDPRDRVKVDQKDPHPAWVLAGTTVKVAAGAFIAHDFFNFTTSAVMAAGTTFNDSYNQTDGNYTPIRISSEAGVVGDVSPRIGDDNSVHHNIDDHSENMPPEDPPETPPEEE